MQGKVHVAIGTATAAFLCVKYPNGFDFNGLHIIPYISLLAASAGSYAPDIDMQTTHSGKKHKTVSKVVNKVGGGHRGITHTLLFPTILYALMIFTNNYLQEYQGLASLVVSLIFGFGFGWIMHIFADLFNGKGCPIFWPIMRSKVHIMDLPSSGIGAWIFAIVYISILVLIISGGIFK